MSELKHTPGPWGVIFNKANPKEYSDYHIVSKINNVAIGINSENNARIISCAPEMLEILIDNVALEEKCNPLWRYKCNIIIPLIEKATGLKIEEILEDWRTK